MFFHINDILINFVGVNLPAESSTATNTKFQQMFCHTILESHKFIRTITKETSSVSLRDVARCLKMNKFFHEHFKLRHISDYTQTSKRRKTTKPIFSSLDDQAIALHSMLLALSHCYYYRLGKTHRNEYLQLLSSHVRETPKRVSAAILFYPLPQNLIFRR
jgi:hypothetical protein